MKVVGGQSWRRFAFIVALAALVLLALHIALAGSSGLTVAVLAVVPNTPRHVTAAPFSAGLAAQPRLVDAYGRLPLSFEANGGQVDPQVRFLSRGQGHTLFLTDRYAVLVISPRRQEGEKAIREPLRSRRPPANWDDLQQAVLRVKLRGAEARPGAEGLEKLPGTSNYFIGNDPSKWRANIPNYAKVRLKDVYSGVDLVYYGSQGRLEYDFVVRPGGNPEAIELAFEGAESLQVDESGDLVLRTVVGEVRWRKPVAYQEEGGARHPIQAAYALKHGHRVGFEVAQYDAHRPLVIDPVLVYSTCFAGTESTGPAGVAVDASGSAYLTGGTLSTDFPAVGALQAKNRGNKDAFVAKLNPSGSAFVYSTYLGGAEADSGHRIAVDTSGNAYLIGSTESAGFPTVNPLQPNYGSNQDAFIAKLNPTGSALLYSTYFGGSSREYPGGIAVDSPGNIYFTISTSSTGLRTVNALQSQSGGDDDVFVGKLNAAGSALLYASYLGGSKQESDSRIAVDISGNIYVGGSTRSANFPTASALQTSYAGPVTQDKTLCLPVPIPGGVRFDCTTTPGSNYFDGFVAKINPSLPKLVYSTYLGGGGGSDSIAAIAADASGNAYVAGYASSGFPVGGASGSFVLKLSPTGTLVYATFPAGCGPAAIAVDASGNAYMAGSASPNLTTVNAIQGKHGGGASDACIAVLNPAGSTMVYSTFLGGSGSDAASGIALDASGNAYVTGSTDSVDFPASSGPMYGGTWVAKISPTDTAGATCTVTCVALVPPFAELGEPLSASGSGKLYNCSGDVSYDWNWGDASPNSAQQQPTHTYFNEGTYTWAMTASAPRGGTCGRSGTIKVGGNAPRFSSEGVVNAASFSSGAVASGEMVTIFGRRLGPPVLAPMQLTPDRQYVTNTLADTRVLFDGIAAPLVHASATQVTAVVPSFITSWRNMSGTRVQVEYKGVKSETVTLPVAYAAPGIFTADSSGRGQGAILNQDGTLNSPSNPAQPGSVISLWAAGAGEMYPVSVDGKLATAPYPTPTLPVSVTIDGMLTKVLYAGAAPGMVAGVLQVNARIPAAPGATAANLFPLGGSARQPVTIAKTYGNLPLSFEPNQGQFHGEVRFAARGVREALFLTDGGPVAVLKKRKEQGQQRRATFLFFSAPLPPADFPETEQAVLRMRLLGTERKLNLEALERLLGTSNYFIGNDPSKWRTNIPNYAKVRLKDVYPGVDLFYYGAQGRLEYDFVVRPGADPSAIELAFDGTDSPQVDEGGDLVLRTVAGDVRWRKPVVYQEEGGTRHPIQAAYALKHGHRVAFEVGQYDARRPLVIDPVLVYSTYSGYPVPDRGVSIAVDGAGNAYLAGDAAREIPDTYNYNMDTFVRKLNAAGSALLYSAYLGGENVDIGRSIAVDASGNAYLAGETLSADFPVVNALNPRMVSKSNHAFVAKLDPSGTTLLYSTYLCDCEAEGVAVDGSGSAYVTGATQIAGHGWDAFVAKLKPSGSALDYRTDFGGSNDDWGVAIAVDASAGAYITGATGSSDFPIVNAAQASFGGGAVSSAGDPCGCFGLGGWDLGRHIRRLRTGDAFVVKLNPSGSAVVYSTYLGGTDDDLGYAVAVDASGSAYVTGATRSHSDFPTVNAMVKTLSPSVWTTDYVPFVAKLDASGSRLLFSTYLSENGRGCGKGIAVDGSQNVYLLGDATSLGSVGGIPTANALQPYYGGWGDAFVAILNPTGSALLFSTYFGGRREDCGNGIALDAAGNVYLAGTTESADFPVVSALQARIEQRGCRDIRFGCGVDAWVAKISPATTRSGTAEVRLLVGGYSSNAVTVSVSLPAQR